MVCELDISKAVEIKSCSFSGSTFLPQILRTVWGYTGSLGGMWSQLLFLPPPGKEYTRAGHPPQLHAEWLRSHASFFLLTHSFHPGASKPIHPGTHMTMKPRPVELFLSGAEDSGAKAGLMGIKLRTWLTSVLSLPSSPWEGRPIFFWEEKHFVQGAFPRQQWVGIQLDFHSTNLY